MSPRDTRTGGVLESMILPALAMGEYTYRTQVRIGIRPGGRRHNVDVIAEKADRSFLVSLKWQQVGGRQNKRSPLRSYV